MNNGQTTIIETDLDSGENEVTIIDNETGQIIEVETGDNDDQELEAVEGVADSAVLIAEIEANKEVEIAEIQAAVAIAHIENENEQENESDISWLKNQMENQALAIASIQDQVSLLSANLLTPPISPEPEAEPEMMPEAESLSESADVQPEAEPEPRKRRFRAI